MSSRGWITVIVVLAVILCALMWLLFTTPAQTPAQILRTTDSTSSPQYISQQTTASSTGSLNQQVSISAPTAKATLPHTYQRVRICAQSLVL